MQFEMQLKASFPLAGPWVGCTPAQASSPQARKSFIPLALALSAVVHLSCMLLIHGDAAGGATGARRLRSVNPIRVRLAAPSLSPAVTSRVMSTPRGAPVQKAESGDGPAVTPSPQSAAGTFDHKEIDVDPGSISHVDPSLLPFAPLLEPYYFRSDELTQKPTLLQDVPPDLTIVLPDVNPRPARLRLLIDENGTIDKVVVEDSQLSEAAERFVRNTFAGIRFNPGRIGDMAVKSQIMIEVTLEQAPSLLQTVPAS